MDKRKVFRLAAEQAHFLDVFDTDEERLELHKVATRYAEPFFAGEVVELPNNEEQAASLLVSYWADYRNEIIEEVHKNIVFDV